MAVLAEECRRAGALLVHYSTDYVFDGAKSGSYLEDDPTGPLGIYGASKLAGEFAVRESGCPHVVFRTSWVYAARGKNFLLTMMRLARERERLSVVDDQVGAPTWARALADVTSQAVGQWLRASPGDRERLSGTYHATAGGQTSWYGFARAIFDRAAAQTPGLRVPVVEPIPSSAYPTPARRPANSVLDNSRLSEVFGLALAPWDEALTLCMEDMAPT